MMPTSHGAVAPELARIEIDMDQLGVRIDVRIAPVAEAEVERRAEDQDDVGAEQRRLARAREEMRIVRAAASRVRGR